MTCIMWESFGSQLVEVGITRMKIFVQFFDDLEGGFNSLIWYINIHDLQSTYVFAVYF